VPRPDYLLGGQPSELARLQLQSLVWESTGRQLLSRLGDGSGVRAVDVGCGALGWLRILSEWVGPSGHVVGTDVDKRLLDAARGFLDEEKISNVQLVVDDLFDSRLEPQSFHLLHARYLIAPLGRGREQVAAHRRLVRPGGSLVLEEWDLPYLRLPLQFSVALESRLLKKVSGQELALLRQEAETELAEPGRWGTTFTLIQTWGTLDG